jgi:hypothetical protein
MAEHDDTTNLPPADESATNPVPLQDMALDLNFVPNWARKPASEITSYEERGGPRHDRRRDSRDGRGGGGRDPRGAPRGDKRPDARRDERRGSPSAGGGGSGRPERRPDRGNRDQHRGPPRQAEERINLPIDIHFLPDRDRLGAVVRQLHAVRRAFPLTYLASLFLVKPEHHMLKLEVRAPKDGSPAMTLFQCRETKAVFLTREEAIQHLVKRCLDQQYERVEVSVEPPTGNFVCVGRCKRSGELLGPPNYHGYNERLMDVHRTRFSHIPLADYRGQVEMVRDPAVVEQWKESCRVQVRYRPKDTPEAPAELTLLEAENQFVEKHAPAMIHSGPRMVLPGSAVALMNDPKLLQVLNGAWNRENRFPFTLMLALRPAFKRMRLHLFKAGKDETFVTAIPPKPFDAEHAIPEIKDMIALISEHPGWNLKQLVDKLYPGKAVDDPDVAAKINPLQWLIEKGHIIEFFNGTYAVPGHLRAPNAIPTEQPQEHHHPEVAPDTPIPVDTASLPDVIEAPETTEEPVSEA